MPAHKQSEYMSHNISNLLKLNKCTVIKNYGTFTKDGNSAFFSLPPLKINDLFSNVSNVEMSANFVHIDGYGNEPVHHHISYVVGVIIKGHAYLKTDDAEIPVEVGDVVVVPQGVNHEFVCEDGKQMDYMAYEIAGRELDFKKHF